MVAAGMSGRLNPRELQLLAAVAAMGLLGGRGVLNTLRRKNGNVAVLLMLLVLHATRDALKDGEGLLEGGGAPPRATVSSQCRVWVFQER